MNLSSIPANLTTEQQELIQLMAKSCRHSILSMVTRAESGHPGGSLSAIDFLVTLYSQIIAQTGEKIVVSNGHISPAVYSVLAEMGYLNKEEVIAGFRKVGKPFEGHVTRHVPGIWYGTGPLGVGVSAASGMAWSEKFQGSGKKVFAVMGDGEFDEGQVHEMMHFAAKYQLSNLIVFVDYNRVQLSASLAEVMPINLSASFAAAGWKVLEFDGHDTGEIWQNLVEAYRDEQKPVVLLARTVMGKGSVLMEKEGLAFKSTWHGKAPKLEQIAEDLAVLTLSEQEQFKLDQWRKTVTWRPEKPLIEEGFLPNKLKLGEPKIYPKELVTDCRSAYGQALLDLAELNPEIVALTADLAESVKTSMMGAKFPERHIDCGIAEQQMISAAGGMAISGLVPFASTFGAFISSRAKDQARVNDINHCNVKMVATHCGLSVGEDGPTHQAIDDQGSFLGFFNTRTLEPCDPNQTDRLIRFVAGHQGNFYVRMGRHKIPVLTKINGELVFGADYQYYFGRTDLIREGADLTIVASGPMVHLAVEAADRVKADGLAVEVIAVSTIQAFDQTLWDSLAKTKKVLTLEDHNLRSGLAAGLALQLAQRGQTVAVYQNMGVTAYQLSGKPEELYSFAGIGFDDIVNKVKAILIK